MLALGGVGVDGVGVDGVGVEGVCVGGVSTTAGARLMMTRRFLVGSLVENSADSP